MSTGLKTLGNDGIDAVRFEPARLSNGSRRREYLRAPGSHSRQQFSRWQTKMKTYYSRLEFGEHIGGFGTEGCTPRPDG